MTDDATRSGFQVRELEASDALALGELLRALAAETEHVLPSPRESAAAPHAQAARTRAVIDAPNQQILVAEDTAHSLIGFVALSQGLYEKNAHVASVMVGVRRAHWRRGVGRALMDAALGWASGRGIARVELTVAADNAPARALYAGFGFVEEGRKHAALRIDGRFKDELLLARLLP